MFLRFIKKFSRPKIGFVVAILMLFAPAFIATTVESAGEKNVKATPTPKKKATPTPKKATQAKTKPTPKKTPTNVSKSKTTTKGATQTTSKNKTKTKVTPKTASKTAGKNSKTGTTKNSKQTLTVKNDRSSKRAKTDKNKNTSSKITKPTTADKNKTKPVTTKITKPTTAKTTPKTTPKTTDKTTERNSKEFPQIIVTTFSVPVRSQAKSDAPTLSSVKLGTVLRVTEKNPAWYKVQYSAGGKTSTGWISANSTSDLNASGKTEIYHQIVERNYKPQMDFASATEIYEFLSKIDSDLDSSDKSAELELKRLLVLRSAVKTIPVDKKESSPFKEFLKTQEKELVYSEPSGEWLVVSNQFWDLHEKYKKSVVSDTIAWEAANNPLPGECEGYINCYLFDMRMRFGEYLNLHPNGKNAAEALKNITDYLSPIVADSQQKTIYNGPTDVTDRAEFNNLIAELRTIVARLSFVEKEKTLQQLRQIAEAYR